MANLARVRTLWSGSGVVGPGVSTFYFDEAGSGYVAAVAALWTSVAASFPSTITWTTASSGDLIDIATGELSGSWNDGTTQTAVGTSVSQYAAGVGCRIKWVTAGIRNGRRVYGSTFLVPIDGNKYDAQGTIGAAHVTTYSTAAAAVVSSAGNALCIYSRPGGGQPGMSSVVTNSSVPDQVSWLRSRRS
jgi:hypothetical protein